MNPNKGGQGSLTCKKHKLPVVLIHALVSSSYGNFLCEKCKEDIGESILSLLRPSLYTVPEFLEKQNTADCEKAFLAEIHKTLVERQAKLKEISTKNEEQMKLIEKDFANIFKMFMSVSETAKKYLKERIEGNFKKMAEHYKFLVSNYKSINAKFDAKETKEKQNESTHELFNGADSEDVALTIEAGSLEELIKKAIAKNAPMNQLRNDVSNFGSEIEKSLKNCVVYKRSELAEKFYMEVNQMFEKQAKEFFRKFKQLLENPNSPSNAKNFINTSSFSITQESMYGNDMRSLDISKISDRKPGVFLSMTGQNMNRSLDMSQDSIASLNNALGGQGLQTPQNQKPSRNMRQLSEFPKITSAAILNAIKSYGNFSVAIEKPLFKGLPECGPVLLEDNSIYQGQMKDEMRVGRGKCLMPNGSFIDGYWNNDIPDEICRVIHKNGDVYEGYVKEGVACGKGVFLTSSNYRYIGQWANNQRSGQGEETCQSGSEYKGKQLNR